MTALKAFTEHVMRGRWDDVRSPNPAELAATSVLSLPIAEASAKIRTGPPIDDAADYSLPVWAGVLTLRPGVGRSRRRSSIAARNFYAPTTCATILGNKKAQEDRFLGLF